MAADYRESPAGSPKLGRERPERKILIREEHGPA
jgi:hypothetical protein